MGITVIHKLSQFVQDNTNYTLMVDGVTDLSIREQFCGLFMLDWQSYIYC